MTEAQEEEALQILEQVRTILSKAFESNQPESFATPILTNYPIKALLLNQDSFKVHGYCEIETKGGWEKNLDVERAKEFTVLNLFVQLRSARPGL
jgi:hypothetical protein